MSHENLLFIQKFFRELGTVWNGAKLVGIWDDFRRPLFDVGGVHFFARFCHQAADLWAAFFDAGFT